jgi:hypothetical protein
MARLPLTTIVRCEQDRLPQKFTRFMKTLAQRQPTGLDLTKRAKAVLKASVKLVQQRCTRSGRLKHSTTSAYIYEIRPRADKRGVDLISTALPDTPLWYRGPNAIRDAIDYAKFYGHSHEVVICVYDDAGNVVERHAQPAGDFREFELRKTRA